MVNIAHEAFHIETQTIELTELESTLGREGKEGGGDGGKTKREGGGREGGREGEG